MKKIVLIFGIISLLCNSWCDAKSVQDKDSEQVCQKELQQLADYFSYDKYLKPRFVKFCQTSGEIRLTEVNNSSISNVELAKMMGNKRSERSMKNMARFDSVKQSHRARLTPADREFIKQQRRLAENFCHVDRNSKIVIEISQEDAEWKGIASKPYEEFKKWVRYINMRATPMDENYKLGYYQLMFDDSDEMTVIKTLPVK